MMKLDPFPRLTNWLIRRTTGRPFWHILSADGEQYMGRYWLFNANWRYSRWTVFGRRPLFWLPAIRLHHITQSDQDRHMHDHPWNNISILLRGCYTEVQPRLSWQPAWMDQDSRNQARTLRLPFRPVFRKAQDRHRLVLSPQNTENGVWSLFIMFRRKRRWGFYTEKGWVYYRDYLGMPSKEGDA